MAKKGSAKKAKKSSKGKKSATKKAAVVKMAKPVTVGKNEKCPHCKRKVRPSASTSALLLDFFAR